MTSIFPMATDHYTIFSRHLAALVKGELPTFFSMVISHDDGVGVAVYATGHEMLEAANAFLDSLHRDAPTMYTEEDVVEFKKSLIERGGCDLQDIACSRIRLIEHKLGQLENSREDL